MRQRKMLTDEQASNWRKKWKLNSTEKQQKRRKEMLTDEQASS